MYLPRNAGVPEIGTDTTTLGAHQVYRLAGLILSAGLAAGCMLGPDYQRPEFDMPETWPQDIAAGMEHQEHWMDWWRRYEDPILIQLVETALAENLDINLAAARVREARAALGLRRAAELPVIRGEFDANRQDFGDSSPIGGGGVGPFSDYRLAASLSYEVDLWGRLARATEAARARLLQSSYSQDAIRLNVISETVATYFELRAIQDQIAITNETIHAREESYQLEEARLRFGAASELSLRQAEAELERTRAELPRLQARARNLRRALGILTGDTPRLLVEMDDLPPGSLSDVYFDVSLPAVLPSDMLERRPDIRAAEAALVAANADIGVARANWFPRIDLLAVLGTGSSQSIANLFSGPATLWQLGGSVVQPLLDTGNRRFEIEGAEVRHEVAELEYRASVRNAFVEVGDTWELMVAASDQLEIRGREVEALEAAMRQAQRRYQDGFSSYLEVLDAKRSLFQAQLQQIDSARDRLAATVTLFKALGGGWPDTIETLAADMD